MLEKATSKDTAGIVHWERQDAESLTFPAGSFNAVFMSHLLHHLDRPQQALDECNRVLTTPGVILIRYGAIEQIRDDYRHTFFAETLDIDETRTPSVRMVEARLKQAGFSSVRSTEVRQKTFKNSDELLKATRHKLTSVLTLISEQAFSEGLKMLTDYVEANPNDPWLLENRLTLTMGHKRRP
jgi:SAM-dependent methyltransferase